MLLLQICGPEHDKEWNAFLLTHDLPCYGLAGWRGILKKTYNKDLMQWAVTDSKGQIIAFCAGYENEGVFYTPYFGFYAPDPACAQMLSEAVKNYCIANKIGQALLTSGSQNFLGPALPVFEKHNMALPLLYESEEKIWFAVPKKTKNMVRKAEKESLVSSTSWDHLHGFYDVYKSRMAEKDLSVKPLALFTHMKDAFGDTLTLFTLHHENRVEAGMLFLESGSTVSYLYNASLEKALRNGGNNLLMWEAMKYYKARGKSRIELGESSPGGPVFNFKKRLSDDIQPFTTYHAKLNYSGGLSARNISRFISNKKQGLLARLNTYLPGTFKKSPAAGRLL